MRLSPFVFSCLLICAASVAAEAEAIDPAWLPASAVPTTKEFVASGEAPKEILANGKLEAGLHNGDFIFIRSTSKQSQALEITLQSKWTHVGLAFKVADVKNNPRMLAEKDDGAWYVLEASSKVQFTPLKTFIGARDFAVKRLKRELSLHDEEKVFEAGKSLLGSPYDIYFLLSLDGGKTRNSKEYCSGLTWYAYAKGLGIVIGTLNRNSDVVKERGKNPPLVEALITERFYKKTPPMSFEKWREEKVIPPQSQFDSPLMSSPTF